MKLLENISNPAHLEYVRNLSPYIFTYRLVPGQQVLDLGVGKGTGSYLFQCQNPRRLVSADLDPAKIEMIHHFGFRSPWSGVVLDAQHVPFAQKSFDVIACFEVIEHVPDPEITLAGLKRVLADGGVLVMTTPNRDVRLFPWQPPANPEHFREYNAAGFLKVLQKEFKEVKLMGIYGSDPYYGYYRGLWKPSLYRFLRHFAWITAKKFLPLTKRAAGAPYKLALSEDLFQDIQPEGWPFYPLPKVDGCLNLFAVCGDDPETVSRAFDRINNDRPQGS